MLYAGFVLADACLSGIDKQIEGEAGKQTHYQALSTIILLRSNTAAHR